MKLCMPFLLALSVLALSSCGTSIVPPVASTMTMVTAVPTVPEPSPSPSSADVTSTPDPTSTPMLASQIGLPRLSGATHVGIVDNWDGLSPAAPINARYSLDNSPSGLIGEGNFSSGSRAQSVAFTVAVPPEVAAKFFSFLDDPAMTVREGTYEPLITHTDDYPFLVIGLTLPSGVEVRFYSKSQGADHVPWGLDYNGKTYIVDSARPQEALSALRPYLREKQSEADQTPILEQQKTPAP
ncbi:MAG: hypothetical protein M3441_14370 [Chloroflexota bacterium]|nr:hypothetical protein [Chloroflexota bacterium]